MSDRSVLAQQGKRLELLHDWLEQSGGRDRHHGGCARGQYFVGGVGIDGFIEVTSGSALLWRLAMDADVQRREQVERRSLRIVGGCFLGLAAYVAYETMRHLITQDAPAHSMPGIRLAGVSLVVMPLLSRAKRSVGRTMTSAAMQADARQAEFFTYLSVILLGVLLLNMVWGLWWADPVAALVMVPIIAKEGIDGLRWIPAAITSAQRP